MRRSAGSLAGALAVTLALACSDSMAPNQPPTATISVPSAGFEAFFGDPVAFQGSATDPETGALSGSALTWRSSIDGTLGMGASLTVSTLSAGSHSVTLTATDPAGGTGSAQVAIDIVVNQAPAVSITAPADMAQFLAGEEVQFDGAATDPEDGALSGSDVSWRSSLDGSLGTGTSVSTSSLTVGTHDITLTATDTRNLEGSATISVTIAANAIPVVAIDQPADEAVFLVGDEITFSGTATDDEDGALAGSDLVWSSSLDGTFGSGASVATSALTVGSHVVTLAGTDAQGQVGTDEITVHVTPPTGLSPTADFSVTCAGLQCDFTDESIDADGNVVGWNWDFGDGAVSTDQNPQHTFSWGGPHTIALVVSDDSGNDSDPALDVVNLTSPVLPGFQVEIRVSAGTTLTPGQLTAVQDAVSRWQEVVTGDLAEEPLSLPPNACGVPTPALSETVDDLVIYLQFKPIDGPGGILGSAGPCWVRSGSWLPALGIMSFDADDMANMESNGLLADVLLHEMGHVLGFGTLWSVDVGGGVIIHDFLRDPTDPASPTAPDSVPSNDTHFIGPFAIAAFDAVSNPDYTAGAKVPVENDNQTPEPVLGAGSLNGHWREVIFTNELMSPLIGGSTNPLSLVTVESLRDMGYDVDAASADAFSLSFSLIAGQSTTGGLVLRDDIRTGPIFFADPTGRLMMIDGVRR